jgi:hypothetical protein
MNPFENMPTAPAEQGDSGKFKNFSAALEQTSTRGDGSVEKGPNFKKSEIDYSVVLNHLKIHSEGTAVAGSIFNGEVVGSPEEIKEMVDHLLPETLNYDQHGRVELTFDVEHSGEQPIGWSGVKSIEEIQKVFPDAKIKKEIRMLDDHKDATEEGIAGAWYPEKDKDGNVINQKGKFEPLANIVTVDADEFKKVSATNKISVIIEKDKDTQKPKVLTIYPGENAPMFPAKIPKYEIDTLIGPAEEYWKTHAFIRPQ